MVMLPGGADTYNMIVPHTCTGTNRAGHTVREQYDNERATIRIKESERELFIDAPGADQPCSQFALHSRLPILRELFNAGDLSFFMNAGVLNQPVTIDNFEALTVTQLFAHTAMQQEIQQIDHYDQVA